MLQVRVCGGLEIEADGRPLPDALVGGRQGRLVLAFLVCERPRAVRREELAELLWPDQLPDSWTASLSAVISRLRRLLTEAGVDGSSAVVSAAGAYQLVLPADARVDLDELAAAVDEAEAAATTGDVDRAVAAASVAEAIGARGFLTDECDWVDRQREVLRDLRVRAGLARSAAQLGAGAHARAVDAARDALALDASREATYRALMRGLIAAGERAEALRVWERCRIALVEELGVDPSPETEAVYLEVLGPPTAPVAAPAAPTLPSGVVTFLLTDIVESSALWDDAPDAMDVALERHDALVAEVVANHGGTLLKSKLEGDATVSVFARASDGASAALALQDAVDAEPWPEGVRPRLRMAMHTGEAFERNGDYFGPALNRAARLRSLAGPGDVLLSQAVTELVRDHLPSGAVLRDLGHRDLRGLSRGENVCALAWADREHVGATQAPVGEAAPGDLAPPALPAPLTGTGPFVGRGDELSKLIDLWDQADAGSAGAVFIGGEPGVGKSRLASEIARHAHGAGAVVLYGRCDEDLAAPLQPFIEALRLLVPALGPTRMRAVRGIDELARVVPEVAEQLPDRAPAVRADPDTERLALFDAVTSVLVAASAEAPVLLVLDDLHWAGKTTLSLLRHVLRGAKGARLLVAGTYRDTELARTHPLAETLADLRREAAATRVSLSGLGADDIEAYLNAVGIDDRALGRELTEVTSGNPFFLIEVLRHVEETGGAWTPGNLPEGVREATGRRLSRLSDATNQALSVAAVIGAVFDLALVERAQGSDLVDEIAEACQAGLVVEEPGSIGRFRFAHALVRQVLLAELVTVKRVRLHRLVAELLEAAPLGDDADARLADLAYHWSECASLGDAAKAVDACRRAGDRAMERLAYEEAGDLYGMALQALDGSDDEQAAIAPELHLARCDALLTSGDVTGARVAIDALEGEAGGSERLAAWYTTYEGLLAVLAEPDRLTEIVQSIGAAAGAMREIGDLRGEARAHFVHASALERLGQIGAAERALDAALAAARSADDRRLGDSILAEAPPAALWGPSSVTRASGRCLDVVRVLRINDGAPAVEAVALRCQAVLEALRGRFDAARRMVGSARRTVERLGLTHRLLETDVAAGYIELLAGDAPAGERLLRSAYEGLRERGLGGEAAQAAAFLGRSLILQGRIDEADEAAAEAEALAGSDLKAAIAWRDVRAEAAAIRGDADRALALAREAVELAAPTDALLLVVDARLTLATVLRAIGDDAGAEAESRRAAEACEAKGATALAAQAHIGPAAIETPPFALPLVLPCPALEAAIVWTDQFNRAAQDEIAASRAPGFRFEDRRPMLEMEGGDGDRSLERNLLHVFEGGVQFDQPEVIVSRGRAALLRWTARRPGAEWPFLIVFAVDASGRMADYVMFEPEDRNAANVELDRITPDVLDVDSTAWRTARRFAAAINAKDLDGCMDCFGPGYERIDRRTGSEGAVIADPQEVHHTLFTLDDFVREVSLIELQGDGKVLVHDVVWFRDGEVSEAEVASVQLIEVDEAGRIVRQTGYDPHDIDRARAELRRESNNGPDTLAARVVQQAAAATNAHDWDALVALLAPDVEFFDRRGLITVPDATELRDVYASLFATDDWRVERTVLATHGEQRVVTRDVVWFRDGQVSEGEVETLELFEVDGNGLIHRVVSVDAHELDALMVELHRSGPATRTENTAWLVQQQMEAAFNAQDMDAIASMVRSDFVYQDRRSTMLVDQVGEEALSIFRSGVELDQFRIRNRLLDVRGDRLALVEQHAVFSDGSAGPAEISALTVIEVDEEGRMARHVVFEHEAMAAALVELEARARQLAVVPNRAWEVSERFVDAYNQHDADALLAFHAPGYEYHDRRGTMSAADLDLTGAESLFRLAMSLDEFHLERRLLATHGDLRVLVEERATFRDGAAGPAQIDCLAVFEIDEQGRTVRNTAFAPGGHAEALAELDGPDGESAALTALPNRAWEVKERFVAAYNRGDLTGMLAMLSPDYSQHDRRSRVTEMVLSGADVREWLRVPTTLDEFRLDHRILATHGEHRVLVEERATFRDGETGPAQIDCLSVFEIDEKGRPLRNTGFAPSARAEAFAALHAADQPPVSNLAWQASLRQIEVCEAKDWDRFAAIFHPDFRYVDERRAMWVPPSSDAMAIYGTMFELDEWEFERVLLASRGDRLALVQGWCRFRSGAAGPAEVTTIAVTEVHPDGRLIRETAWEPDQIDDAMAYLEARSRELLAAVPVGNAAWAASQRQEAAIDAGDWDAFMETVHPDLRYVDHRHSLWVPTDDPLATYRLLFDLDDRELRRTLLDTRGDRLALYRVVCRFEDGDAGLSEVTAIGVFEVASDGRVVGETAFDTDDMHLAVAYLESRWRAGEAVEPIVENAAWRAAMRLTGDSTTFTVADLEAICHPEHVYIDLRPAMWVPPQPGTLANWRAILDLDEWELRRQFIATRGDRLCLSRVWVTFRDGASGPAEVGTLVVHEVAPDGLLIRETSFEPDAVDEAMAALEARWQEMQSAPVPNRAWEVEDAALEAFARRDWDAFIAHFDPDFEIDERRHGLSIRTVGDDALATLRMGFDLEATWVGELIGTGGDRLALERNQFHGSDGEVAEFLVDAINVVEITTDGLIRRHVVFDVDDLDAAAADLRERQRLIEDPLAIPRNLAVRSVEREGWTLVAAIGEHTCLHDTGTGTIVHEVDDAGQVIAALSFGHDERREAFLELLERASRVLGFPASSVAMSRAAFAGDAAAFGALVAESCTVSDHRRLLQPQETDGAVGYVASLFGSADLVAPDHLPEVLRMEASGPTPWGHLAVVRMTGSTPEDGVVFESPYLSVLCWDEAGLMIDFTMYEIEDIELARAHLASRRPPRHAVASDPLALPRSLAVRSVAKPGWTLLAALGDHLCLHGAGERFILHEVDDDGEVIAMLTYSSAERRAAADELARRSHVRHGIARGVTAMNDALNAHDVVAFRAAMADDAVVEDHRRLRLVPTQGPDEYVQALALLVDQSPDYRADVLRHDAIEPWGHVSLNRLSGTSAESAAFEGTILSVVCWNEAGLVSLLAMFEPEDLDAALDRLEAARP